MPRGQKKSSQQTTKQLYDQTCAEIVSLDGQLKELKKKKKELEEKLREEELENIHQVMIEFGLEADAVIALIRNSKKVDEENPEANN